MSPKKTTLAFIIFFFFIIIFLSIYISATNQSIIGNKKILDDINNLLPALDSKNITENDFDQLKSLVNNDQYASGEVNELITLTKYKEYSHVGHGIGFLYDYIKTGNQSICPGHLLSHYYVFLKYNETSLAEDNLNEAKEKYPIWQNSLINKNQTYLNNINFAKYDSLFNSTITKINQGNSSTSDDMIYELADAPCV